MGTRFHSERGVTLIEMMVVLAIMGIIFSIAAPNFKVFIMNSTQATAINEFIGYLNFARSEATKRGSIVRICRSNDGATCNGAGVQWEDGLLIYQDVDDDGVLDVGEPILKVGAALDASLTMRGSGNAATQVRFNSRGFAPGYGATIRYCDSRGAAGAKASILAVTGRVRAAVDGNADGIVEDGGGTNVTCP